MNATIAKFGWPATLVAEFDHWVVLLRPAQPTLGSLVLAAKGDATAFGELPGAAHAELKTVTAAIEAALEGREGQVVDEVELDDDGDRLAWDISLDKADRQDADEVLVDAKTGEVVSTDG